MTTPIADGTYYIRNVAYPKSIVDLVEGLPYSALASWHDQVHTNLQWIVKNVGNNQITLENSTARGFYASTYVASKGSAVFASENPTPWTVVQVSSGVYNLKARDLQLQFIKDGDRVPLLLGAFTTLPAENQQWKFEPVKK